MTGTEYLFMPLLVMYVFFGKEPIEVGSGFNCICVFVLLGLFCDLGMKTLLDMNFEIFPPFYRLLLYF